MDDGREQTVNPGQVLDLIERFAHQNSDNLSVELRWLAAYLSDEPSRLLRLIHTGRFDDPIIAARAQQFRRDEISTRKGELRAEIDALDAEDRTLAPAEPA